MLEALTYVSVEPLDHWLWGSLREAWKLHSCPLLYPVGEIGEVGVENWLTCSQSLQTSYHIALCQSSNHACIQCAC